MAKNLEPAAYHHIQWLLRIRTEIDKEVVQMQEKYGIADLTLLQDGGPKSSASAQMDITTLPATLEENPACDPRVSSTPSTDERISMAINSPLTLGPQSNDIYNHTGIPVAPIAPDEVDKHNCNRVVTKDAPIIVSMNNEHVKCTIGETDGPSNQSDNIRLDNTFQLHHTGFAPITSQPGSPKPEEILSVVSGGNSNKSVSTVLHQLRYSASRASSPRGPNGESSAPSDTTSLSGSGSPSLPPPVDKFPKHMKYIEQVSLVESTDERIIKMNVKTVILPDTTIIGEDPLCAIPTQLSKEASPLGESKSCEISPATATSTSHSVVLSTPLPLRPVNQTNRLWGPKPDEISLVMATGISDGLGDPVPPHLQWEKYDASLDREPPPRETSPVLNEPPKRMQYVEMVTIGSLTEEKDPRDTISARKKYSLDKLYKVSENQVEVNGKSVAADDLVAMVGTPEYATGWLPKHTLEDSFQQSPRTEAATMGGQISNERIRPGDIWQRAVNKLLMEHCPVHMEKDPLGGNPPSESLPVDRTVQINERIAPGDMWQREVNSQLLLEHRPVHIDTSTSTAQAVDQPATANRRVRNSEKVRPEDLWQRVIKNKQLLKRRPAHIDKSSAPKNDVDQPFSTDPADWNNVTEPPENSPQGMQGNVTLPTPPTSPPAADSQRYTINEEIQAKSSTQPGHVSPTAISTGEKTQKYTGGKSQRSPAFTGNSIRQIDSSDHSNKSSRPQLIGFSRTRANSQIYAGESPVSDTTTSIHFPGKSEFISHANSIKSQSQSVPFVPGFSVEEYDHLGQLIKVRPTIRMPPATVSPQTPSSTTLDANCAPIPLLGRVGRVKAPSSRGKMRGGRNATEVPVPAVEVEDHEFSQSRPIFW